MGRFFSEPTLASLTYQIHIVGEVNQPGTYRITASDRLQEVIERAGGVTLQGSMRNVQVRRKGTGTKTYDLLRFQLYGELQYNPYLLDNDVIFVPLRKFAVEIVGSVRRPRTYELRNEHTMEELINLAGGFSTGVAYNAPIRLIRFIEGQKQVFEITNTAAELRNIAISNGDVIYVPNVLAANREFDYNVVNLPGDNVFYPSYEDRVFVLGGVHTPGPYPFNPYTTVSQYLTMAGGVTKLARVKQIRIMSITGERRRTKRLDADAINPGDAIYVPEPRIPPEGWISIVTGLAGFGLSTTATVLSLTR